MNKSALAKFMRAALVLALAAVCVTAITGCDREIESAEDGSEIKVAFLAGTGGVNDGTMSEQAYRTLSDYCGTNDIPFRYYQHTKENKVESEVVLDAAVADGYNVIVCADYTYATAIADAQYTYPEVAFVSLDTDASSFGDSAIEENVTSFGFQEVYSGYFAGYAAVAMGYRHIGYLGGMAVPGVVHYEAGYIQGADQAARDLGVEKQVTVETVMGNQFFGDNDISAYMDTWYQNLGVECVFACGGGIYTSAAGAAKKVDGKVIGVDADQKKTFDTYQEDMCITSALKNLDAALRMAMDMIRAGEWSDLGGKYLNLGVVSGTDPTLNYVGIPLDSTQWCDSFTQDDYIALLGKVYNGEIQVSNEVPTEGLAIVINDHGNIK